MSAEQTTVDHRPAESRFVIVIDDQEAEAVYEEAADQLVFTHTEVPIALRGKGLGTQLVRAALTYARTHGLRVVPRCAMFAAHFRAHPEEQDLLSEEGREFLAN